MSVRINNKEMHTDKKILIPNPSGVFTEEDLSVIISRDYLKMPGTVMNELGLLGKLLYFTANEISKRDIDVITINGQPKDKQYSITK